MKQYYITSKDFRLEGDDPTIPDNYIDPVQLAQVKKLAGIDSLRIMSNHLARQAAEKAEQEKANMPKVMTGTEKAEYQRVNNIQPGTDQWYKLWYAKPDITGESPI